MVSNNQVNSIDWNSNRVMHINYTSEFKPLNSAPNDVDADDVGTILSVVDHIINDAAKTLDLGKIRFMRSWGSGRGINLNYNSDRIAYELRDGVSSWSDLVPNKTTHEKVNYAYSEFPNLSSRPEINVNMMRMRGVECYGIKNKQTNEWDEDFSHAPKSSRVFNKLCEELFKIDVIFKTQLYPRTRLCLSYKYGQLLMFVNEKDYFIIYINQEEAPDNFFELTQLGECFILT